MGRGAAAIWLVLTAAMLLGACDRKYTEQDHAEQRKRLVRETMEGRGIKNARVLAAMRKVRRHLFVPAHARSAAYADRPLEIGYGQTISQPFIVAYMTEAANPQPQDRCLEVGTGSGYQAAVLAELCAKVFTIEYIPQLAELAKKNLRAAGYGPDRVELYTGDGYRGWPEEAPFQVIVVTAAPPKVPRPLLDQLALRGRLIVPVGPDDDTQYLELWTRAAKQGDQGLFSREELLGVRFVPFLGEGIKRQ